MQTDHNRSVISVLLGQTPLVLVPFVVLAAFHTGSDIALAAVATVLPFCVAFVMSRRPAAQDTADRDALTGLMGRDALIDWAERSLPRTNGTGRQVAVIVVAIESLDVVEERFGRDARDAILLESLDRLRRMLREGDTVARIGNKLAIGFEKIRSPETEALTVLAKRIQSTLDPPFTSGPTRAQNSVALGIAAGTNARSSSGTRIVAGAQRACEQAVISGPGSIHFHSGGLSRDIGTDRNIAQDLSTALETSEIFAWFQPQIRNLDGKVTGFEALARWDHPERGLLAPACFLRDIEKSGLSQRLAEVVLKQSLIALNIWDASGFDVSTVSVNFSGTELRNPRLPDYIRWELDRHGIAPDRLVIEVLETVASESSEDDVSRTLTALSRIGCRIDLDDFGTGSNSFMNIRRFDVDRIKIDKSLVNKIDCDDAQYAMLSAVLAFGEKLGIDTLAEGVETSGEAAVLASLGCGTMQGYAISRPMPLGETLLWLEDRAETWPLTADAPVRGTA